MAELVRMGFTHVINLQIEFDERELARAAGIRRAPLTTAAILCALGYEPFEAINMVASRRVGADFPEVYVNSLLAWAAEREPCVER
jgi:hypothetical protein